MDFYVIVQCDGCIFNLELVACTKEGKVHESVIAVEARPVHIHTALLLLGAKNGSPASRQPVDNEQVRWIDIPPHGDPIEVFLVWKDANFLLFASLL